VIVTIFIFYLHRLLSFKNGDLLDDQPLIKCIIFSNFEKKNV